MSGMNWMGAAEMNDVGRASGASGAGGGPLGTPADPALLAALTSLAARTRELVEAVVLSDAAVAELGAAAAEIGNLAARLGVQRRSGPIRFEVDPADGRPRRACRTAR